MQRLINVFLYRQAMTCDRIQHVLSLKFVITNGDKHTGMP